MFISPTWVTTEEVNTWSSRDMLARFQRIARKSEYPSMFESLQEVKSSVAKFFILDLVLSQSRPTSLALARNRWLREVREPLHFIHARAKGAFSAKFDQAAYFALHTAVYLRTGLLEETDETLAEEDIPITCPYDIRGSNFILTLLESNVCMCTCFAFYMIAAAQEYGWDDYIRLCVTNIGNESHATIILCKPMVVEPRMATKDDLFELNYWEQLNRVQVFNVQLGEQLLFPRIEAQIEMSIKGVAVGLTIRSDSTRDEWTKYIDEFHENRVVLYPKRQAVVDDLICWYPSNNRWNVIAQLVKSNAVHKANFYSGLRRFVLLGALFQFEDVTNLILRRIALQLELKRLHGKMEAKDVERLGLDYGGERPVEDGAPFESRLRDEWQELGLEIVEKLMDKLDARSKPENVLLVARIALADSLFWREHEK